MEASTESAKDAWRAFQDRWPRLKPPLRPSADVVAALSRAIAGHEARVLQLGVTPELAGLGADLTAVDWSADMIAGVWPGDTATRRALLGDWRAMPPAAAARFTAVVGDGSLNALAWADVPTVLAAAAERLAPGGCIALRCYVSPDAAEDLDALTAQAMAGREPSPHAFKWRVAMALRAAGGPDVALADIWAAFDRRCPDRAALARATGWSVADIGDFEPYRDNPTTFCFPTRAELRAALPPGFGPAMFAPSGDYPLADRCPILVAEKLA